MRHLLGMDLLVGIALVCSTERETSIFDNVVKSDEDMLKEVVEYELKKRSDHEKFLDWAPRQSIKEERDRSCQRFSYNNKKRKRKK